LLVEGEGSAEIAAGLFQERAVVERQRAPDRVVGERRREAVEHVARGSGLALPLDEDLGLRRQCR
jgi:hypothetical protein